MIAHTRLKLQQHSSPSRHTQRGVTCCCIMEGVMRVQSDVALHCTCRPRVPRGMPCYCHVPGAQLLHSSPPCYCHVPLLPLAPPLLPPRLHPRRLSFNPMPGSQPALPRQVPADIRYLPRGLPPGGGRAARSRPASRCYCHAARRGCSSRGRYRSPRLRRQRRWAARALLLLRRRGLQHWL